MSAQLCKNKPSYYLWMLIIIFCMFGFRLFPAIEPLTPVGMQVVGVFLGMVIGWSTVGLLWPSILGLVAVGFTGYVDTPLVAIQSAFTNANVLYVLFLFIFVGLLKHAGIMDWMAYQFVKLKVSKNRPWILSLLFLEAAFVLAALVDVMAAVLIVWEIFYKVASSVKQDGNNAFVRFNITGIMMLASTGVAIFYFKFPYILLASAYEGFSGIPINGSGWFMYFTILGQVLLFIYLLLGKFVFRINTDEFKNISVKEVLNQTKLTNYQRIVVVILTLYMVCMLLPSYLPAETAVAQALSGLGNAGITAVACVLLTMWNFTEGIAFNTAARESINWDIFFITAAAIYISSALTDDATGVSAFLAGIMEPLAESNLTILIIVVIIAIAGFLTGVMNSIVVGMLFSQIGFSFAMAAGINPAPVVYGVLFVINYAYITPAGCALAPLYHGRQEWIGGTKHATMYGILCSALGIVVALIIGWPVASLVF